MSAVVLAVAVAGIGAITWALWAPTTLATATARGGSQPSSSVRTRLSVVVPARDEAGNVPALLDSLARSGLRPDELIVVDDGSADATAALAAARGASVVPAGPLPAGWAGKPHACAVGAAHASGDVLVFLDADVRLAPGALGAVARLRDERGGLVSVQPHHVPGALVEELSAVFNVCAVAGSGAFAGGAARRRGTARVAFGPCLAIRRDDYAAAGGHAGVAASVIEDVALAHAVARSGRPVSVVLGGDDVTFRMYPGGWRPMVEGWTKNIALGAANAPPAAVLATVVWVAALLATAVATVLGVARWATGGAVPVAALAAYALLAVHTRWVLRRVGSFRPLTALLFPVPAVFFVVVFVRSLVLVALRRPVRWRGRRIAAAHGGRGGRSGRGARASR